MNRANIRRNLSILAATAMLVTLIPFDIPFSAGRIPLNSFHAAGLATVPDAATDSDSNVLTDGAVVNTDTAETSPSTSSDAARLASGTEEDYAIDIIWSENDTQFQLKTKDAEDKIHYYITDYKTAGTLYNTEALQGINNNPSQGRTYTYNSNAWISVYSINSSATKQNCCIFAWLVDTDKNVISDSINYWAYPGDDVLKANEIQIVWNSTTEFELVHGTLDANCKIHYYITDYKDSSLADTDLIKDGSGNIYKDGASVTLPDGKIRDINGVRVYAWVQTAQNTIVEDSLLNAGYWGSLSLSVSWQYNDNTEFCFHSNLPDDSYKAYYYISTPSNETPLDKDALLVLDESAKIPLPLDADWVTYDKTPDGHLIDRYKDSFFLYAWVEYEYDDSNGGTTKAIDGDSLISENYFRTYTNIDIQWTDSTAFTLDTPYTRVTPCYYITTDYANEANLTFEDLANKVTNNSVQCGTTGSLPSGLEKGSTPFLIYAWVPGNETAPNKDTYIIRGDYPVIMPAVTASPEAGAIAANTTVSLSESRSDAKIYYTTDGTIPRPGFSPSWNGTPVTIAADTDIYAKAFFTGAGQTAANGYQESPLSVFHYTTESEIKDQYEDNNSFETAREIAFPSMLDATISTQDDLDFYCFKTGSSPRKSANLLLKQPAGKNYGMVLYDEAGKELWRSKGAQSCVLQGVAAEKTYIIEIYPISGYSDKEPYTLRILPSDEASVSNASPTPDYSEMNLMTSWFGKKGDRQSHYEGSEGYRTSDSDNPAIGGFPFYTTSYLSEWYGPVKESLQPYDDTAKGSSATEFKNESGSAEYHMQNAIYGPMISPINRDDYISALKNLIYSYGAVTGSIGYDDYSEATPKNAQKPRTYYFDNQITSDARNGLHEICFVGWDDTKDRTLFKNQYGEMPEKNGALLVKNSWGTGIGENGFFWISYETASLGLLADNPCVFIMEEANGSYDRQYLNDATGFYDFDNRLMTCNGAITASNLFTASQNDQLLKAVSLVTTGDSDRYSVSLTYENVEGKIETKQILSGTEKLAGYYTKRLKNPIRIPKGTDFTLTETLYNDAGTVGFAYGLGAQMNGLAYLYNPATGAMDDISSDGKYPCLRAFTVIPSLSASEPKTICNTELHTDSNASSGNGKGSSDSAFSGSGMQTAEAAGWNYTLSSSLGTEDLPASYDLRNLGLVTVAKNQGTMNDCWAFASIASVESSALLNGSVRLDYPRSVKISPTDGTEFQLTGQTPERTVSASAAMNTDSAASRVIFWTFSGNLDSIQILNQSSLSGDSTELFRFLKPGKITAKASCDADISITDEITFTALNEGITGIAMPDGSTQVSMPTGSSLKLNPVITPSTALDQTLLYTSSNSELVSVDADGTLHTYGRTGTAVITIEGGTAKLELTVTVYSNSSGDSDGGGRIPGNGAGSSGTLLEPKGEWIKDGLLWKFALKSGGYATNVWAKVNNLWYHFGTNGTMSTGWLLDNTKWYLLDSVNGDMKTGYVLASDNHRYFLNQDGSMATGDILIDGVMHHFNPTPPSAPTYKQDPVTGLWEKNDNNELPYGAELPL